MKSNFLGREGAFKMMKQENHFHHTGLGFLGRCLDGTVLPLRHSHPSVNKLVLDKGSGNVVAKNERERKKEKPVGRFNKKFDVTVS